jgi:hypothetical protein
MRPGIVYIECGEEGSTIFFIVDCLGLARTECYKLKAKGLREIVITFYFEADRG